MATDQRITTARLLLEPFVAEFADALEHDRARAADIAGATLPDGWPDEELRELLATYVSWLREDPARLGFGPWAVSCEGAVLGSAGFQGTPREDGAIEIGFDIHPDHRNRAYATEAAEALLGWGLGQRSVERVVARCRSDNAASIRVLQKIGMVLIDEVDGELSWERSRGFAAARSR